MTPYQSGCQFAWLNAATFDKFLELLVVDDDDDDHDDDWGYTNPDMHHVSSESVLESFKFRSFLDVWFMSQIHIIVIIHNVIRHNIIHIMNYNNI